MQKSVSIEDGVAQPRVPHPLVQPFVIGALREPDPQRTFADQPVVLAHGGAQLSANRLRMLAKQWQITVGGTTGEQIHHLGPLKSRKAADQVSITRHPGGLVTLNGGFEMIPGLCNTLICKGEKAEALIQPAGKTLLQVWVTEQ